jgi:hypothetical protein
MESSGKGTATAADETTPRAAGERVPPSQFARTLRKHRGGGGGGGLIEGRGNRIFFYLNDLKKQAFMKSMHRTNKFLKIAFLVML